MVILAAGKGTRMRSAKPKVLHKVCGRSMLGWVLDAAAQVDPDRVVVVVGHGAEEVEAVARAEAEELEIENLACVLQEEQKGTGHAMQVAATELGDDPGIVLALYGDMPLITAESLDDLIIAQREAGEQAMVVLTADLDDPDGYGRILRDEDGALEAIVEHADADADELEINEINTGVYAFAGEMLLEHLPRLEADNAQEEYYLTDLVEMAVEEDLPVVTVTLDDASEGSGVNDLAQLAAVRSELQYRILEDHMAAGVAITDPASTYVDYDVEIGPGTTLLPCVMIHRGVRIGADCEVGPFTHLRPGTELHDEAVMGNFTEAKNSTLGAGSKAKHLSYLGDAIVGERTNIGCGTIFANYDNRTRTKSKTYVGNGVAVGSGTVFVAPNKIPDHVTTAAGAVILPKHELAEGEVWAGVPAEKKSPKS